MATIAFFLALGGGAVAAFRVPKNSIGTNQLKNGAVTGSKLHNGAVTASKFGVLPAVRVTNSGDEATSDGVYATMTFNTSQYDNAAMHSSSTNTSRLTARTTGVYDISGQVAWTGNAVGTRELIIMKNGAAFIGRSSIAANTTSVVEQQVSAQVDLRAGEYVELLARQNSGGQLNVIAEDNEPMFAMHWLGP
jgi:hypothetical protein